MKRDLQRLTSERFDVCVIGGGIYGAWASLDAALRGLSVALVEKADFASATSANSQKTIHGGFRYLQHGDIGRMRQSIRERRTLMRLAPHLVHPMPVLVPTHGGGLEGRRIMRLALLLNDLVALDRNSLDDPAKRIPAGRILSRREALDALPLLESRGLTGAALFYDAQVHSTERLVVSVVRSAVKAGAAAANYVRATGLLRNGGTVTGIEARDELSGEQFEIRARAVVNTAGPWVGDVMGLAGGTERRFGFARAVNIVTRPLTGTYAVGISARDGCQEADALVSRGRLFFVTPWNGRSIVGTHYAPYDGRPDDFRVTESDALRLLEQFNRAVPSAGLRPQDIAFVHGGLVPTDGVSPGGGVRRARRYEVVDHRAQGISGLVSVLGVKYTTARDVAQKAVESLFAAWGRRPPRSRSAETPVYGGDTGPFDAFMKKAISHASPLIGEEAARRLALGYGSAYLEVLDLVGPNGVADSMEAVKAQARYAVRHEMAHKLSDVVLRRTDLGSAGHPGEQALSVCAQVMAQELGWSPERTRQEVCEVEERYLFSKVRV